MNSFLCAVSYVSSFAWSITSSPTNSVALRFRPVVFALVSAETRSDSITSAGLVFSV